MFLYLFIGFGVEGGDEFVVILLIFFMFYDEDVFVEDDWC